MDNKIHAFFISVIAMRLTLSDIVTIMERFAPPDLAEPWDNSGMQVGSSDWAVNTIWVALDATLPVVEDACKKGASLLITHHPLIFKPISCLNMDTPLGRMIDMAIRNRLAIYSAHTNLDKAIGGVNDVLAATIGLENQKPLEYSYPVDSDQNKGFGRVGQLSGKPTLEALAEKLKQVLGLNSLKFAGRRDLCVEKAAVCSGSGSSFLRDFLSSDAQVYISGDLKYHDARIIEEADRGLIDIGHYGSEKVIVKALADYLRAELAKSGHGIGIDIYKNEKDPFVQI